MYKAEPKGLGGAADWKTVHRYPHQDPARIKGTAKELGAGGAEGKWLPVGITHAANPLNSHPGDTNALSPGHSPKNWDCVGPLPALPSGFSLEGATRGGEVQVQLALGPTLPGALPQMSLSCFIRSSRTGLEQGDSCEWQTRPGHRMLTERAKGTFRARCPPSVKTESRTLKSQKAAKC